MSVQDTLNAIKTETRLPTREEASAAAEILLLCNGMDLSDWSDELLPCDEMDEGLKSLIEIRVINRHVKIYSSLFIP